ncbi:Hypothetical predicted protein [Olea europaea subsp. europaea]|uniref:Uncharacterized protein n=1 Tax=Olea europaea subsp. europaea TaxID=158383 RepID=A0A8S0UCR3_OLEEU|nr:Hypothetical predicted protein [Olea europaea subsp. europaea]
MADDHSLAAKLEEPGCFSNSDVIEICDMEPPEDEMAMPYMIEVQYEKPIQPDQSCGEKRNGGSTDRLAHLTRTSTKPSASKMKKSTPMLLITDGKLEHSDMHIDDDDFVDPPPR